MRNILYNIIIASAVFFAGCADSFYAAENYLTGPVDGVGLKKTTTIISGGREKLEPVVTPARTANKNVTWMSSDDTVVTVDSSGVVTAVAVVAHGMTATATVTVTTVEGNFSTECKVTVVEKPVHVTGVSISKNSCALLNNDSIQLSAEVFPSNATNQNLVWSSDNPAIASVDGTGLVSSSLNVGTTAIRVKSVDGGLGASCIVTVTATPVSVTGVSLNKASTVVAVGSSEKLFASITPVNATSQNVTWSVSDAGVAGVDQMGNVTGNSPGTADVTVTALDGGWTATASVSVVASPVAVTGVSISKTTMIISSGVQEKLIASVLPSGATSQSVIWKSSNVSVASVDSGGVVTGLSAGNATITVQTADGGFSKSCMVVVLSEPSYTVTYESNGATSGTSPVDSTTYPSYATVIVLNSGTLSRTGYTFAGWSTSSSGSVVYVPGSTLEMGSSAVTLYAVWTMNAPTYTVTYVANGGTGSVPVDSQTYAAGATVTVKSSGTLSRTSFSFGGWVSGPTLQPGDTFTMGSANVTLTAKWVFAYPDNIYIAGNLSSAIYLWHNGIAEIVPGESVRNNIFITTDNTVYMSGEDFSNGWGTTINLWINNVKQTVMPSIDGHMETASLYVSGVTTFIGARDRNLSGAYTNAVFWINTDVYKITNYDSGIVGYAGVGDIYSDGTNIFIVGFDNSQAMLWKYNGSTFSSSITLADGVRANAIAVSGSKIFVVGINDSEQAVYWYSVDYGANFTGAVLLDGGMEATSVFASGGNFYAAGYASGPVAVYWQNGGTAITLGGTGLSKACDITVSGSNIYIVGEDDTRTKSYFWVNGVRTELASGTNHTSAKSIFIRN